MIKTVSNEYIDLRCDFYRASELKLPATIEVKDKQKKSHTFQIIELGREETWHNPSLLLATLPASNSKIVFSQIHLEIDPMHYYAKGEERSIDMLEKSNEARFDIVRHLFEKQFNLDITREAPVKYTQGYFLGLAEVCVYLTQTVSNIIMMILWIIGAFEGFTIYYILKIQALYL